MADEIIDLSKVLEERAEASAPPGTMALWGADGERSRFALPLWRVVHLAGADWGVLFWRSLTADGPARPFVVLDMAREPARLDLPDSVGTCLEHSSAELHEDGPDGLVVCLGSKDGRAWGLYANREARGQPLPPKKREDILFLAGECAGLLFLRDFASEVE